METKTGLKEVCFGLLSPKPEEVELIKLTEAHIVVLTRSADVYIVCH